MQLLHETLSDKFTTNNLLFFLLEKFQVIYYSLVKGTE